MIARLEVTPASALELENVECADNKLSGEPVFFKKGSSSSAFVIRSIDESGACVNTSLLRVSTDGKLQLSDRNSPIRAKKKEGA